MKITYYVGIAALAAGSAILLSPRQVPMPSKHNNQSDAAIAEMHEQRIEKALRLWKPVSAAMASGDVDATRKAVADYLSAGEDVGYGRVKLGRFYLEHGDLVDAKAELDHVVDPFDPLVKTNIPRRARTMGATDAEALCLWEAAAVNAPESEKQAVLDRWYANYNKYGMRGNVLDDYQLTPEALTEFTAGQYCIGNSRTYGEAVKHFRRATALSPKSLQATEDLADALRFNGDLQEAKVVAVRASQMTNKESDRRGILWGAHVSLAEAKKIAAADKP